MLLLLLFSSRNNGARRFVYFFLYPIFFVFIIFFSAMKYYTRSVCIYVISRTFLLPIYAHTFIIKNCIRVICTISRLIDAYYVVVFSEDAADDGFSPSSVQYTFVHNIIIVSHTLHCTNKVRGAIPARSYSLLICVMTQQCLWCRPSPYTMGLFVSQIAMSVNSNYVERHKTRKMDFQEITMLYILPEWFYANRVTDSLKAFVLICAVYGFPIFANSVVQLCDVRPEIRSHSIDCTTLSLSLSRL